MLRLARLGIDTWREPVAYLNRRCTACAAGSFLGPRKVEVAGGGRSVVCALNVVDDAALVAPDALALSAHAFDLLGLAEGAAVSIRRAPEPASRPALRARIAGRRLGDGDVDALVEDMAAGRYTARETAGFLVAAAQTLDDAEVIAFARARAERSAKVSWPGGIVVDKHSMGGIPGTRVTMVAVPVVIAHGLTIPKAASRAITSPAGTADAMEVLARVDLDASEVRRVVGDVGGCIVWNGRLSHSPIDDVMNAVTRPLGIVSDRLSVSSILSKKAALGITHIVFDIPVGPTAKVASDAEAAALARLFEVTAEGLGIAVRCEITDGSQPIGRGVGPALEARDAMKVLANDVGRARRFARQGADARRPGAGIRRRRRSARARRNPAPERGGGGRDGTADRRPGAQPRPARPGQTHPRDRRGPERHRRRHRLLPHLRHRPPRRRAVGEIGRHRPLQAVRR